MLGLDTVAVRGKTTMAIADVSGEASWFLRDAVRATQRRHRLETLRRRALPEWGAEIFSAECVFVADPPRLAFEAFVEDLVRLYWSQAASQPLTRRAETIARRLHEQRTYCERQRRNERTRATLAGAFGDSFAESYLAEVLFPF